MDGSSCGAWRPVAARLVVVVGVFALVATSEISPPQYFVLSPPIDATFDAPPSTVATQRFRIRVEGHPVLTSGPYLVRLSVPDVSFVPPLEFGAIDAGALPANVPSVSSGSVTAPPFRFESGPLSTGLVYEISGRCEADDFCEREISVSLRAAETRRLVRVTLTAAKQGVGDLEPPPGRITIEPIEEAP